ncbi:hypothetical protein GA0070624_4804 [Micromonospora rhizosphaerae]|uniref:Uncharacterized protein n=1 Tax=Micromonospora rhizosphaerae TaxID=568872 RepID=A0A1C6SX56_9ACTN|nr:hypothetical protein GA0070624_4804 [Micromonospora rhizosphaerae]
MPPTRPNCACTEHDDELADLVVPVTEPGVAPMTVEELVACGALGAGPVKPRDRWWEIFDETDAGPERIGPFHWTLWVGDEARSCYDDAAALSLDQSLLARPGVQLVEWMDREEFLIGAPALCASGILAAAARALADPRVRQR